jgi:1-acyl-sn-glycerol-3-phosphate acyltransferase
MNVGMDAAEPIRDRAIGQRVAPLRTLRAVARLLLVAVLVSAVNALSRVRLRRGADADLALRIYSRLSAALVRLLGVAVDTEGSPPARQCVVVANHRSYVDIPLLMSAIPSVFLSKIEIGGWPLFGTAARLSRTVFVDREDRESRNRALGELGVRLDRGERIIVFPEGTTTTGPGCSSFRAGAFRLAASRGIAVVPVAIAYGHRLDAWVDDTSFVAHFLDRFRQPRMRVSMVIGPELHGTDAAVLKDRAERWIRGRLSRLDASADA